MLAPKYPGPFGNPNALTPDMLASKYPGPFGNPNLLPPKNYMYLIFKY
jgi:hypothetical protein